MRFVLYQVEAPHFNAGVEAQDGVIVRAAPILGWAKGLQVGEFIRRCRYEVRRVAEGIDEQMK